LAKEFIYLKGKVSWVRHLRPDDKYGKWNCKLHPDVESLEKIRELQLAQNGVSGIKNVLGKDDDGYYMGFSRPVNKLMRGQVVAFTPPVVVNADGSLFQGDAIGNGTDATIKIEVYTHGTPGGGKARACRWESMRIDHLVPFDKNRDLGKEELEAVKELVNQPTQLF